MGEGGREMGKGNSLVARPAKPPPRLSDIHA